MIAAANLLPKTLINNQMKKQSLITIFIALISLVTVTICKAQTGIIAYNVWNQPIAASIYQNKDVKTISYAFYWSRLESKPGIYDFTVLDTELKQCIAAGKTFNIRIAASGRSPQYVIDSSLCMDIKQYRGDGSKKMFTVKIPAPYDAYYQTRWILFIEKLSQHINANAKYAAALQCVSITGISLTNEEMRMPNQLDNEQTPGSTNYIDVLKSVNYSGQKILNCFTKFQRSFVKAFPKQKLVIALGAGWFPTWADGIDINKAIIDSCATAGNKDRYVFIQTSLTPSTTGGFISKIKAKGFVVGFQTNASIFDNPACLTDKTIKCSDKEFIAALKIGLSIGNFVEVQQKRIIASPAALKIKY